MSDLFDAAEALLEKWGDELNSQIAPYFKWLGQATGWALTYRENLSTGYSPAAAFFNATASWAGEAVGAETPLGPVFGTLVGGHLMGDFADATIDGVSQRLTPIATLPNNVELFSGTNGQLYTQPFLADSDGYIGAIGPYTPVSTAIDLSGIRYFPYPANAGSATDRGTRRCLTAPASLAPATIWS